MGTTQEVDAQRSVLVDAATHSEPSVSTIKSQLGEVGKRIACGSAAGIVGKCIEYPFDTIKVRLQSQPDCPRGITPQYTGPLDCFRKSVKHHGVLGLYRGVSVPVAGATLETSSLFFFESLGRETVYWSGWCARDRGALPLPALWYSGAFSGAFSSFVLTPIELVKCNMQVPLAIPAAATAGTGPTFLRSVVRAIYQHSGFCGFWCGQTGIFIREVGGGALWFGSKATTTELFYQWHEQKLTSQADKSALRRKGLPWWQQAAAGASAGLSYNFFFFPADTVKCRMQTSASLSKGTGAFEKKTFWKETKEIWSQHRLRGFYRGCGITLIRSMPASAFIFTVYDWLTQRFHVA